MSNGKNNNDNVLVTVAWERLHQAAGDVNDPMRLVSLGTIDPQGRPQARLMILRGASGAHGFIWFHTDVNSRKIEDLLVNRRVSVLAYDPSELIQLRLSGEARVHTDDRIADEHWQQTTVSLVRTYGIAGSPRSRLPFSDPRLERLWHHQQPIELDRQRETFAVIQVDVDAIEWHQVKGASFAHIIMQAANGWEPHAIQGRDVQESHAQGQESPGFGTDQPK